MFNKMISNRESGILLYGITPPRASNSQEKIEEIAARTILRIEQLEIDGLVVYDLQDETLRNNNDRPFPFSPTIDAFTYVTNHLGSIEIPVINYCSVGKLSPHDLEGVLNRVPNDQAVVFVGSPSSLHSHKISLDDAYNIRNRNTRDIRLGGVAIPERHYKKRNEHFRIAAKTAQGCSFFITQCVYNIEYVKDLVSDLYYYSFDNDLDIPTLIFTLTPCGSLKTLSFLDWLGIHVPKWLINELSHSKDILDKSVDLCINIAEEITDYCFEKRIPFGFNIESVAIKKDEIEASEKLLQAVTKLLNKKGLRTRSN